MEGIYKHVQYFVDYDLERHNRVLHLTFPENYHIEHIERFYHCMFDLSESFIFEYIDDELQRREQPDNI